MPNCLYSDKRTAYCNVFVTDTPERTELTVNTRTHNLTLNEGDRADFTRRRHGRPSPSMQLVNVTSGQAIQSTAGGDVTVEDKVTWLNHSLTVSTPDITTVTSATALATVPAASSHSLLIVSVVGEPGVLVLLTSIINDVFN